MTQDQISSPQIGCIILGGTGYGAGELLRLLSYHPKVAVHTVLSRSHSDEHVSKVHPHLFGFYPGLRFRSELSQPALKSYSTNIVFSALPHEASSAAIEALIKNIPAENNLKVIDLSGAYRLTSPALHKANYPEVERSDALAREFTYGLTELDKGRVQNASYIANPGCLATASILSLAPVAKLLTPEFIVFDTKTGSSGSGRELKETTHHPTRNGNFTAYKPLQHQHEPEVLASLQESAGLSECEVSFIAQSLPVARGIYVTTHVLNKTPLDKSTLEKAFEEFANAHPFIRFRSAPPHMSQVLGTNFCDVSFAVQGRRLVVMSCIDNLVKGMAGQAIQNMNIACHLPEETGLLHPGIRPY